MYMCVCSYQASKYHMATAPKRPWVGHSSRRSAFRYDVPPISTQPMNCIQEREMVLMSTINTSMMMRRACCQQQALPSQLECSSNARD